MIKILPVIMCGGSGTRVWPESREALPKQFIPLLGTRSTFQTALEMLGDRALFEPAIVITNHDYRFLAAEQAKETGVAADIVLEPSRRDSGAAVAVATELALRRGPDTVVAVFAADHRIEDRDAFLRYCREAAVAAAAGSIVTFGIAPTRPATGFGYLRPGAPLAAGQGVRRLEAFVEKPDAATAARYVAEGYLWNSGNFVFRADTMKAEIERFAPDLARAAEGAVSGARRDLGLLVLDREAFERAPKIAIDYAVMERTDHAAVIAADMGWSDVGTWQAVWELSEHDERGNAIRGSGLVLDGRNNHIRSDEMLTAVVGLDNVVVVTTQDAVLVLNADKAAQVKDLVDQLKRDKRPEALEHRRSYRPWGYYQSIDRGGRYQVKRIVVKPAQRLSLQKHFHRAEHWIVVRGTAEVTVNDRVTLVHENESIYLPIGCTHRMANPGKIDLELIEVQTGSYLGEDDIVRIEDVYNRS
ncbi:mannose-1-phosphate guanylyltransferase/mannose-6-phosphate isomerase [Lichenihabitans sp. Uapishka_5]|uniref:mannose-1-phosphate guanylyltransferase/mannose-6-phosphate isomerase n=1 Tax=Lichenihabitans sp. Uapishka_5 TaxID=3037302 RepID=UPI0029E824A3|nr:mannose-1-phosphate guanylyltransferase/mannose-6-phosphate isomerase [Lichenihabitans sp. Uapishka_5]MDX7952784.1 mannose-1-phosphate guanylyltransferase/mannose-6-phosphate isomerase [Lichenihabitans sp. Uapishka_5]